MFTRFALAALIVTTAFASSPRAQSQSPVGLWDAAVIVGGLEIPFRFEVTASGSAIAGSFFNGDEKVTSTGGKFEQGSLVLNFDHYATSLEAGFVNGRLAGTYYAHEWLLPVLRQALRALSGVPE